MSFIFLNADSGERLSASDLVTLTSDLATGSEITLTVANNSAQDALEPLIFLTPSSDLGTVRYPSKGPPRTDYNELLLWGSTLNDAGEHTAGLYYKNIDGIKTYFSLSSGSNYRNGIPLGIPINKDSQANITLGFTPKAGDNTRRLYVGVEIYDSRTDI